jgi:ATP/maltotriose-dependent transcriptional regulator MalT
LGLFRQLDLKPGIGNALISLGLTKAVRGDFATARSMCAEGVAIARALGNRWGVANALLWSGLVMWLSDDLSAAFSLADECLALFRELGDRRGMAFILSGMGQAELRRGDYTAARPRFEESMRLLLELRDRRSMAMCLNGLGEIALSGGDYTTARTLREEAVTIFSEMGDKWYTAFSLDGLAAVAVAERRPEHAARLFGAAEAMREEIGVPVPPVRRASYERAVAAMRAQLAASAFANIWAEGRRMSPEQIVNMFAAPERGTVPQGAGTMTTPEAARPSADEVGLTRREVEVLRLVAQGLTDAQVADKLVISVRTVNWHLQSIYGKVGVASRTAATRYALEHNIV